MMKNNYKTIQVIQTVKDSNDRLTRKRDYFFVDDVEAREKNFINIYADVAYQEINGFGAAITEAAVSNYYKMSKEKREEILNAYFNIETGLGYSVCRTHINSCDASLDNYSYVEKEGDIELKSFTLERDLKGLVPFIKEATALRGSDFKLISSPWSPPAWMKTTGEMNYGGKLKDEYRKVWAKYYAKYINEYAKLGVKVWAITVQNEPKATQIWDSCLYSAEEERDFIKNYLGPTLIEEGLADIKIIIWDHNKERVYERARVVYDDPEASKYVWGAGFHWYSGDHFEALSVLHDMYPEKSLVFTEGCQEGEPKIGEWSTGEMYGHDIIGDLNNWTVSWTDWNIILNEAGGPNHVDNYCDAPIITNAVEDKVVFQSSYYYIGHFSKYIRPGARRIGFSRFNDKLEVTAFKNTDGKIVVVVMNKNNEVIEYYLRSEFGIAQMTSYPHSIMTLIY
ncbi:MAG: glycoside hydrolase family 30 protein [Ruminiclostridium sp.]